LFFWEFKKKQPRIAAVYGPMGEAYRGCAREENKACFQKNN